MSPTPKKTSTSETGHAKNIANFERLISICTGYGAPYNPSKVAIKLPALNTQLTACRASSVAVNTAVTTHDNAVNARIVVFATLKKLSTRILSALDATDAKEQTVADANTFVRKLHGKRAKAIPEAPPAIAAPETPEPTPKTISASQLSFDSQVENFSKLIIVLQAEPLYIPNENELKVATLNTLLTNLKTLNTAVINANTPLDTLRIARDKALYADATGLCDTANEVKKYVKSLFGLSSPEYHQVAAVKFKKIKK